MSTPSILRSSVVAFILVWLSEAPCRALVVEVAAGAHDRDRTPIVVPWPMMALGIFGAVLQTFVFIMLTMVYLSGAIAAEEH